MSGDEKTLVRGDSEKARHPCNTCSVETAHFETEGYIGAKQRELLNATIEAGHAVTHRKHSPSQDQVVLVMDLAESIIKMVLVDPKQADRLDEATPKRR